MINFYKIPPLFMKNRELVYDTYYFDQDISYLSREIYYTQTHSLSFLFHCLYILCIYICKAHY